MKNYEQKYNEALERAREYHYSFDKDGSYHALDNITPKQIVAWLEKQKPVIKMKTPEESLGIDSDTYNNIVDECIYGEKKPAWSEEDEEILKVVIKSCEQCGDQYAYYWLKSLKDRVQSQPKWSEEDEEHIMAIDLEVNRCLGKWHCCGEKCPISEHNPWLKSLKDRVISQPTHKWSEEDEGIRQSLITDLSNASTNDEEVKNEINKDIAWLKSIKDRVIPQPKQEWSERDEVMLGKCIDAASGYYSPEDKQSMKDWLYFLKERYTWKPSDEQMKQLGKYCPDNRPLTLLYEQLKKLREE